MKSPDATEAAPGQSMDRKANSSPIEKGTNMTTPGESQERSIIDRLDAVVDHMATELGLTPRAIYLTPQDYERFAAENTRIYRAETGSCALVHQLSHDKVPIISEHLIDKVEIPVRQRTGKLKSTIYAATGQGVPLGFDD